MSKVAWALMVIAAGGAVAAYVIAGQTDRQAPARPAQRSVAVTTGIAVKKTTPVALNALGNVTTVASVAVKPRIDNEIVGVHFQDGAEVKEGDLLITLDKRALEAQLRQAEAQLARDKAQFEGAERDRRRYATLLAQGATPQLNLDNAKTSSDSFRGAMIADDAAIKNLQVLLSYCDIRATIGGRISQAAFKVGNIVHSADTVPIATINQMRPVYVTFTAGQKDLPAIRKAMADGTADLEAIAQGDSKPVHGSVTMVENVVDPTTGLATVRATMPNEEEQLWPGAIVSINLTLRREEAVVIPTSAVQLNSNGNFVYVVENSVAVAKPIQIERADGEETVLKSGLAGGETVVTDGHLLLNDKMLVRVVNSQPPTTEASANPQTN